MSSRARPLARAPRRVLIVLAALLAVAMLAPAAQASAASTAAEHLMGRAGISAGEAQRRLDVQDRLAALSERLTARLGDRTAGTWIDQATGRLHVAVLDEGAAAQVRAAGAQPAQVAHSLRRLAQAQAALEEAGGVPGLAVAVDVPTNSLVVSVPEGAVDAATQAFVDTAAGLGVPVRVERVAAPVQAQAFYGGEAIYAEGGGRCSGGFVAQAGGTQYLITAGHCTNLGGDWEGDGQLVGPTANSSFPGNDYGRIRIADPGSLDPQGAVVNGGGVADITGAVAAPVGSYVCKSGATTGTTCGYVLRKNATVWYGFQRVRELIETDLCSQPGDSGGPLFAGGQAQGLVSGGTNAGCDASGFRSYYQPIGEVLSAYGLTLR